MRPQPGWSWPHQSIAFRGNLINNCLFTDYHSPLWPSVSDALLVNYHGYHYHIPVTTSYLSYYHFRSRFYPFDSFFLHVTNQVNYLFTLETIASARIWIISLSFAHRNLRRKKVEISLYFRIADEKADLLTRFRSLNYLGWLLWDLVERKLVVS